MTTPTPSTIPPATGLSTSRPGKAPWFVIAPLILVFFIFVYFIFFNSNGNKDPLQNSNKNTEVTTGGINNPSTSYWETHTLKKKGDSVMVRIEYGYHLHTFSVNNKQYGCRYQGSSRQVIGNGVDYDPNPITARFAYLSFENEAEDIDCFIVKNGAGTCPYDKY